LVSETKAQTTLVCNIKLSASDRLDMDAVSVNKDEKAD
jgi:hypothetical protein